MQLVLTKDAMVAGVHFLADDPAGQIAQKLLRVNLSDLAAMGAAPLGYLLALARPRTIDDAWLGAFCNGLASDQAAFAISLLGGDTVSTPGPLTLSLTAIGEVLAAENGDVWDEEALDELRSIAGHVVDQGWIDELGNGRFLRTLYEKSCAYRDLRLSTYPGTLTRDDLSTLRLPDLMQAYGEVLSGRGPQDPPGM